MIYQAVCEYFNLNPSWQTPILPFADSFTAMQFDNTQADDDVIFQCVNNAYDVLKDDAALRSIKKLSADQRGEYFDGLRKHYPLRREFSSYEAILPQSREQLVHVLSGLGFKVETAASHLTS